MSDKQPENVVVIPLFNIGQPDRNGLIFSEQGCETMIRDFKARSQPLYSQLDQGKGVVIQLDRVAGEIIDLHVNDLNQVFGTVRFLETPYGNVAKQVVMAYEEEGKSASDAFELAPRGFIKDVKLHEDGSFTCHNIDLISVDLVSPRSSPQVK